MPPRLVPCRDCETPISPDASSCPKCGRPRPRDAGLDVFVKIVVAIVVFAVIMVGGKWLIGLF